MSHLRREWSSLSNVRLKHITFRAGLLTAALLCVVGGLVGGYPTAEAATRDPLKQPFSSDSIWNVSIGTGAVYQPAKMPAVPRNDVWAPMPDDDGVTIIQTPTAPLTKVMYSSAAWNGRNRCSATRPPSWLGRGSTYTWFSAPMPRDLVIPNSNKNELATWLLPDGRTIYQGAPIARCTAGGYATVVDTSEPLDLYGNGISKSLAASGISGLGGTLRVGELRPGAASSGPRHALRVNIDTDVLLARCSGTNCYRWPASSADAGAEGAYGRIGAGGPSYMKMGALLAIPRTVNLNSLQLTTVPGKQIAWTLQNYGAYVTDSSACGCFAFATEKGPGGSFVDQFKKDYGVTFAQRVIGNTGWSKDMQIIQPLLAVVDNNTPSTIGGGGTRLQAPAPPIG